MTNNHLTYFKVENFKKFDSLEVNDIGQFNLIVGDNNVGKTCFLEALLFDENRRQILNNFYIALTKRGLRFQIEEITRKTNNSTITKAVYPIGNYYRGFLIKKNTEQLKIYYDTKILKGNTIFIDIPEKRVIEDKLSGHDLLNNNLEYLNKSIKSDDYVKQFICIDKSGFNGFSDDNCLWIYDYDENDLNFSLISFNDSPLEDESRNIYENLKTKREKEILINTLKVVNPNITDIELRENFEDLKSVFLISFEDKDEFVPLNFLGDGFKRIFYIVLKALSLRGKRILIDEIEIGIHHSKIKDFWVNIIKVCKELYVQLFATTHSEECTQAFVSASASLENMDEIRLIKLEESTNKEKIYASTFNYNQIIAGLESNVELRG